MIKAFMFDMDGLLLDSERIVQRTWKIVGTRLGIPGLENHIYHTLGTNRAARKEYFLKNIGEDFPLERFQDETREEFYKIVDAEGLPVKKGTREILELGKQHGLRMAVVTSSSREYAEKVLREAEIWTYFDGAVFGDMVSKGKPDPQIYQLACEQLDVKPEEAVAFEDAPNGIRSAHAAGLQTIMIPDMLQPTDEILKLCTACYESLTEAAKKIQIEG